MRTRPRGGSTARRRAREGGAWWLHGISAQQTWDGRREKGSLTSFMAPASHCLSCHPSFTPARHTSSRAGGRAALRRRETLTLVGARRAATACWPAADERRKAGDASQHLTSGMRPRNGYQNMSRGIPHRRSSYWRFFISHRSNSGGVRRRERLKQAWLPLPVRGSAVAASVATQRVFPRMDRCATYPHVCSLNI